MFAPHPPLDDVCCHCPKRAAAALQAARGRGDDLVPGIVARIESAAANPEAWRGRENPNIGFLLFLAAEFRATAAHEPLTRILRLEDDLCYDMLCDIITEDAPTLLADTYNGTPGALLALVEDGAAGPFARNAGLHALSILWKRGVYPREDLLALLLKLAANLDPEGDGDALVGNGLVEVALAIHATEIRGTILGLYERDLVECVFLEDGDVAEQLAGDAPDPAMQERLGHTITNAWEELSTWPFFDPNPEPPPAPLEELPEPAFAPPPEWAPAVPFRAPPKVGRNDPCSCGSGKKFKKCCGA